MYKIKNFRLSLNKNTAWRSIKSRVEGELDDEVFNKVFYDFEKKIKPAAIFDTLSAENCMLDKSGLWADCSEKVLKEHQDQKPKNILALSLVVVCLGQDLDGIFDSAEHDEIKRVIAGYTIETASSFIYRIIKEDAEKEGCTAEKKIVLDFEKYSEEAGRVLDLEKIGVSLSGGSGLNPAAGSFFCIPWTKKKKK